MEGKWEVLFEEPENEFTNFGIRDSSGNLFTVLTDKEKAFQIVREHNAHGELVAKVEEYAGLLRDMAINKGDENDCRKLISAARGE